MVGRQTLVRGRGSTLLARSTLVPTSPLAQRGQTQREPSTGNPPDDVRGHRPHVQTGRPDRRSSQPKWAHGRPVCVGRRAGVTSIRSLSADDPPVARSRPSARPASRSNGPLRSPPPAETPEPPRTAPHTKPSPATAHAHGIQPRTMEETDDDRPYGSGSRRRAQRLGRPSPDQRRT
jgi:hypothetical protein